MLPKQSKAFSLFLGSLSIFNNGGGSSMCVLVAQCVAALDMSYVLVATKERCSIKAMCVDWAYFVDAPKVEEYLSALFKPQSKLRRM